MGLEVCINGAAVGGLLQASITSNNYFSADSFSLIFAVGSFPLESLAVWSQLTSPYIEVTYSGRDLLTPINIIAGSPDSLVADPISGTVSLEGRDRSANLIDSYIQQDFVNQTASEIVQTVAAQHGLVSNVTPTFGSIGRYFGDGYTKLSLGQFSKLRSNWDLVVQLAREQNFDVFVQGNVLAFQPVTSDFNNPVPIAPGDVKIMRLERNLALEGSPMVNVQSWNSLQKASYNTASSSGEVDASPNSGAASSQAYLFSSSNLTSSQTDLVSQQYSREVGRLKAVLHLEMPWNFTLRARTIILLQGTDSSFDGLYQIDSLERRYSSVLGSSQTVRAVSWPTAN